MSDSRRRTENNLIWRKASYSSGQGGNCVEIAALTDGGRAVRDSKNPDGDVLYLTGLQWEAFTRAMLLSHAKSRRL